MRNLISLAFGLILTACVCLPAVSQGERPEVFAVLDLSKRIDGDTVYIKSINGFTYAGVKMKLRLRGIDTPETYKSAPYYCPTIGRKATGLLYSMLAEAANGKSEVKVKLVDVDVGGYGRILADVLLPDKYGEWPEDQPLLSEHMLNAGEFIGVVRPFFRGASRADWPNCH